ncbi:MAG: carboxypeptidase regulatory-like domain-containing protein [Candidatus Acidiferrales bacterium]
MNLPDRRIARSIRSVYPMLALLVCSATASAQMPGTVAARSMIEGRVTTAGNEPLRGATVVLVDFNGADRRTVFTDHSGAFVFANLRPGNYQIQAALAGFDSRSIRVDHDGERDNSLRIVLRPRTGTPEALVTPVTAVWALRIPSVAQQQYDRGIQRMQQKRAKEARAHLAKAIALYPEYATAHAALGSLALAEKDNSGAEVAFSRALEIDANLIDARLGLATVAVSTKKWKQAREHLLKARSLQPDDWRILHQLGETAWQLGLWEEAEPNLRRATELHSDSPRTHLLLINVLALQEKLPETLAAMDAFLKLFAQSPFAAQVREKREKVNKQMEGSAQIPPSAAWQLFGQPVKLPPRKARVVG